jgi:chromate transporter
MSQTTIPASGPRPGLSELFFTFASLSVAGFGGVLPWARRAVVEQRKWLTAEEFNEAFAFSQLLPGPNIVNFSVIFGSRLGGAPGAVVALAGLLGAPLVIVTTLGALYVNYGEIAWLQRILGGLAAAAAGLIIATVAKMGKPLFDRALSRKSLSIKSLDFAPFVVIAVFIAIGILRWPLPYVLIVAAPVSIALAWFRR